MASGKIPANGLDKAIMALGRSRSATPQLIRALSKAELWFLTDIVPEKDGQTVELRDGRPLPFLRLCNPGGIYVPVFSSRERLDEALASGKIKHEPLSAGVMDAKLMLHALGTLELRTVLNWRCASGEVELPFNLMRDIASGKALQAAKTNLEQRQAELKPIGPADYPTDLLQPVFEILRRHPNYRAAWIFQHVEGTPRAPGGRHYQILVHMEPRDGDIHRDLQLVLATSCADWDEADSGFLPEDNPAYLASVWRTAKPFYVATDHRPPPGV